MRFFSEIYKEKPLVSFSYRIHHTLIFYLILKSAAWFFIEQIILENFLAFSFAFGFKEEVLISVLSLGVFVQTLDSQTSYLILWCTSEKDHSNLYENITSPLQGSKTEINYIFVCYSILTIPKSLKLRVRALVKQIVVVTNIGNGTLKTEVDQGSVPAHSVLRGVYSILTFPIARKVVVVGIIWNEKVENRKEHH